METKKKIIIALGSIIAVGLLAYLGMWAYYLVLKKKNTDMKEENVNSSSSSSSVNTSKSMSLFPLKYGSGIYSVTDGSVDNARKYVRNIQRVCNYYGAGLVVDGKWGDKTEEAVGNLRSLKLFNTTRTSDTPYVRFVTGVTTPISNSSKWEIIKKNYNELGAFYNNKRKQWKTSQQMFNS